MICPYPHCMLENDCGPRCWVTCQHQGSDNAVPCKVWIQGELRLPKNPTCPWFGWCEAEGYFQRIPASSYPPEIITARVDGMTRVCTTSGLLTVLPVSELFSGNTSRVTWCPSWGSSQEVVSLLYTTTRLQSLSPEALQRNFVLITMEPPPSRTGRGTAHSILYVILDLPVKLYAAKKIMMKYCLAPCTTITCPWRRNLLRNALGTSQHHKEMGKNTSHAQTCWVTVKSYTCPRLTASEKMIRFCSFFWCSVTFWGLEIALWQHILIDD